MHRPGRGLFRQTWSLSPARDQHVDELLDVGALDTGVAQQAVVYLVQDPDDLAAAPLHPEPRHQPSNDADEIALSGPERAPIPLPQTPRQGGPGGGEVGHGNALFKSDSALRCHMRARNMPYQTNSA